MTDLEWNEWRTYHATLFDWKDAKELAMMNLWRGTFEDRTYTAAELHEASLHLASSDPKKWRAEHLEALLSRIAGQRLLRIARFHDQNRQPDEERCKACGGSGMVSVPHPKSVVECEWVHPQYTCIVGCRCPAGTRAMAKNQASIDKAKDEFEKGKRRFPVPPKLWTIDEYEGRNPDWQGQMKRAHEQKKAERAVRQATQRADQTRGPLRDKTIAPAVAQVIEQVKPAPPVPSKPDYDEPPPW